MFFLEVLICQTGEYYILIQGTQNNTLETFSVEYLCGHTFVIQIFNFSIVRSLFSYSWNQQLSILEFDILRSAEASLCSPVPFVVFSIRDISCNVAVPSSIFRTVLCSLKSSSISIFDMAWWLNRLLVEFFLQWLSKSYKWIFVAL